MTKFNRDQKTEELAKSAPKVPPVDPSDPEKYFSQPQFHAPNNGFHLIPEATLNALVVELKIKLVTPGEVKLLQDQKARFDSLQLDLAANFDSAVSKGLKQSFKHSVRDLAAGSAAPTEFPDRGAALEEARSRRIAIKSAKKKVVAEGHEIITQACKRLLDGLAPLALELEATERLNADRFGVEFAPSATLITLANFIAREVMRPAQDFIPGVTSSPNHIVHGMKLA